MVEFKKEDALMDNLVFKPLSKEPALRDSSFEGIANSSEITGIEVRLSKAHIIDNKTPKVLVFPGYAKMYLMAIAVSDVENAALSLDLKSFAKVGDDESLPIDKSIFFWKQLDDSQASPSQIHVLVSIIKCKKGLRDAASVMSSAKEDPDMKDLKSTLGNIINKVDVVTSYTDILFSLAGVMGKLLGKVEDKPLITWVQSYTDINGDFDNLGKQAKSKSNKYAEMGLSIVVRDHTREIAVAEEHNIDLENTDLAG